MGTPFITLLEPGKLETFQIGVPRASQPSSVSKAFLDAMEVREQVFVDEQNVPFENEFDADDRRACHWIIYASVNKTEELEVRDEDGNVVQPRKSSTRTTPIGTIRVVPFPHAPHPKNGGSYWNGIAEGEQPKPTRTASSAKTIVPDRPTSLHDGKEPYVKIGRLCVIKEFRGNNLAGLLIKTALTWLKTNPSYFDPSITELGLEHVGATRESGIPKWGGLVCVHAQEQAMGVWVKWGFHADDIMGTWWEEGIPHVGMFQRLKTVPQKIRI
ncbi:hypothetical protein CDD81_1143 [Ophiocordyceps australis]|uniref:Uncharacterized protein n=1 Tax=Ophiocordyceps australis TaxID=1399860 RepID=A0A2C5Y0Q6_9HYPO|nr:hypothetical protein CDD81_1143 [Ophiocordyceps australis]